VAADAAHLPFLVLVVVATDPARVLPLTLPHLSPPSADRNRRKLGDAADRIGSSLAGAEMGGGGGIFFLLLLERNERERD
jgi:hypothetical protein